MATLDKHDGILRRNLGMNDNEAPMISDQFNHQVIKVDSSGNIVASYGNINQPGFGTQNVSQGMNGPYSAYVTGDYTGITPPFDDEDGDD